MEEAGWLLNCVGPEPVWAGDGDVHSDDHHTG